MVAVLNRRSRRSGRSGARAREAAEVNEAAILAARKVAFLQAFADVGSITMAAAAVGMRRGDHYDWLHADPEYKKAWESLEPQVTDALIDEAVRRGMHGVEKPLIGRTGQFRDGIVTTVREYSDRMLELLLKARRPQQFRERHEITGKDGSPLFQVANLSDDELDARIAAAVAAEGQGTSAGDAGRKAIAAPVESATPEDVPQS